MASVKQGSILPVRGDEIIIVKASNKYDATYEGTRVLVENSWNNTIHPEIISLIAYNVAGLLFVEKWKKVPRYARHLTNGHK